MSIPQHILNDIRDRIGLADLIGRHLKLTRRGNEYVGLCPFHSEKTPSFTVNEQKGFYHCFGCGAHGDAISFAMNHLRFDFLAAVEQLASDAGIELPQQSTQDRQRDALVDRLYRANAEAAEWFSEQLNAECQILLSTYRHGRNPCRNSTAKGLSLVTENHYTKTLILRPLSIINNFAKNK